MERQAGGVEGGEDAALRIGSEKRKAEANLELFS